MNNFWQNNQANYLNSQQTISAGEGYLVYMNMPRKLIISGTPFTIHNIPFTINTGWNIIGCPYQTPTPFSSDFNSTNCQSIKNFEGFWIPDGSTNGNINFEPGKAYFIKN